jgi:PAS domain S-box-containing protein
VQHVTDVVDLIMCPRFSGQWRVIESTMPWQGTQSARVLIADDDATVLNVLRRILAPKPPGSTPTNGKSRPPVFEVVACGQGQEAIEALRVALHEDRPFSVALLDAHMPPGMDGITTAEHLRDLDPYLQIVLATGYSDVNPMDVAQRVPPADKLLYLQKPFVPDELRHCVCALATKWYTERELREAHADLEQRVAQRTAELAEANRNLKQEIAVRQHAEAALRDSESKYRLLFERSADAILMIEDGHYVDCNDAAIRMLACPNRACILNKPVGSISPEYQSDGTPSKEKAEAYIAETLARGSHRHEWNLRRINGEVFPVEVVLTAISGEPSKRIHVVVRDITDRRRVEEERQRAREQAEAATRAKSAFLANMSHEIRTPMTAILGFADLMLEQGDIDRAPPERIEAARTIKRNGRHLLNIINDILDISKIEEGKMTVERVDCSLCQMVAEVLSVTRTRAEGKGLRLQFEYGGPMPAVVSLDPTRTRQVLINLLSNAVKFTETGTVRLRVELIGSDDDTAIAFDVIDTGIGMTEQQVGNLFQPFMQGDESMTRRFGGTGLGLTISQHLTRLLGGDLVVAETTPGKGTRLRATMRIGSLDGVAMIEDPLSATKICNEEIGEPQAPRTGIELTHNILLAEDGPDNQRLIKRVLERAGAEVTVVENGDLAVQAALAAKQAQNPFDLVLMDMQMPVKDGYEAARELRTLGYHGLIVALTAHAMTGDRQTCLAAGCDDYLTKPIAPRILVESVRRMMKDKPIVEKLSCTPGTTN